jgi:adenosine 3'-phospho 5'-phosphosulfate transporter B2
VLAKAAKVIPVMLMGRLVSRRSYSWSDYVTAIAISAGLFAFLITSTDDNGDVGQGRASTTLSGLIILVGYLTFDSFTSNWQSELFRVYRVSSVEMMAGVNLFSVLLTSVSLVQQGAFNQAADFASRHPLFMAHVLALSITSAVGQLFIFYTISEFGAVTFTIIMTVRQGLAILLSCIVYHHSVSSIGIAGIVLLFAAIFSRMYLSQKKRKPPQPRVNASDTNAV